MSNFDYFRKLKALRSRLAAVGDHPRLADEKYCGSYARHHQIRVLTERAVSLGA